ncbi:hypothetical protein BKA67DRAFT_558491 [Truncatella angustata]|uniref:Uncharacterized protein n=1 Tax=Truncatella angustata TaxID=152316 RepID=A0A9P9A0N3_9PEZI|nr:uncharacterized protein BKA67DRAFT_558491 [Truncatella angustata]KAH6658592.1 hypothetical protein BKA67DRAFT_558491 [Truncatella angustata]
MGIDWIPHSLRYIGLFDYTNADLELNSLLNNKTSILEMYSAPLQVVEVGEDVYKRLARSSSVERCGWTATEYGNRAWLV